MIILIAIFAEIILVIEFSRRVRVTTSSGIILWFIVLSQLCFVFAGELGYSPSYNGAISSFSWNKQSGVLLYAFIFMVVYASGVGIKISSPAKGGGVSAAFNLAYSKIRPYIPVVIAFSYAVVLVQFLSLDKDILMRNESYLLLKSSGSLISNGFLTKIAFGVGQVFFMLSSVVFFVSLFRGNLVVALAAAPPFAWAYFLSFASASRTAALLVGVGAIIAWMIMARHRLWAVSILSTISAFTLVAVISGRSGGYFGIEAIPYIASSPFASNVPLTFYIVNIFQGIFSTSDGISIPADHAEIYKMLSFSIFPSSVDGFRDVLRAYEIRLHPFIPMSAFAEVYHFGILYIVIGSVALAISMRMSTNLARNPSILYVLCTPVLVAIFVQAGAYPTRNVFRQLFIVILIMAGSGLVRMFMARRGSIMSRDPAEISK